MIFSVTSRGERSVVRGLSKKPWTSPKVGRWKMNQPDRPSSSALSSTTFSHSRKKASASSKVVLWGRRTSISKPERSSSWESTTLTSLNATATVSPKTTTRTITRSRRRRRKTREQLRVPVVEAAEAWRRRPSRSRPMADS